MKYLKFNVSVENENKDLIMSLQEIRPNPTDDEVSQIIDLNSCYIHLFEDQGGHIKYIETAQGGAIIDKEKFKKTTKKFKYDKRIIEFKKTAVNSISDLINGMFDYCFSGQDFKVNSHREISQDEVNEKFGAIVKFNML